MNRAACKALVEVFAHGTYLALAVVATLSVLILATWLPNLDLVWQIATSGSIPVLKKLEILTALVRSLTTNFSLFSGLITVAVAVLFGINLALIAYYLRRRRALVNQAHREMAAASVGGLASGFLGVGCAGCGALILSPALTFLGASSLIASLPFGGQEFGRLGVAILGLSMSLGANRIAQLAVCSPASRQ